MTRALYIQLSPDLGQALERAVEIAGVNKKQFVEAMIANAAQQPHKHAGRVRLAWSKYRRQGWWQSDRQNRIRP